MIYLLPTYVLVLFLTASSATIGRGDPVCYTTILSIPSHHQLKLSTKQTTAGGSNSSSSNGTNNSTVVVVSNIWAGTNVKSPKLISIAIVKVKHITGIINLTQCIVVLFFEACENKIKIKITMLDFSAASIILLCLYH